MVIVKHSDNNLGIISGAGQLLETEAVLQIQLAFQKSGFLSNKNNFLGSPTSVVVEIAVTLGCLRS